MPCTSCSSRELVYFSKILQTIICWQIRNSLKPCASVMVACDFDARSTHDAYYINMQHFLLFCSFLRPSILILLCFRHVWQCDRNNIYSLHCCLEIKKSQESSRWHGQLPRKYFIDNSAFKTISKTKYIITRWYKDTEVDCNVIY